MKYSNYLVILVVIIYKSINLLILSNLLPLIIKPFDQSKLNSNWIRWDLLHFKNLNRLEQTYAFAYSIKLINQYSTSLLLSNLANLGSNLLLYNLTLQFSSSINYSLLVSLLYAFSPSPITQLVPYSESFYSFFSFAAIFYSIQPRSNQYLIACLTALATSFRSIGILQSILWLPQWFHQLYYQPPSSKFILLTIKTILLSSITSSPFIYQQYIAYQQFCQDPIHPPRPWCSNLIPSIYNFVQSHYWNNGFLNYWTLNQLPLFILSFPIYWASFSGIYNYYQHYFNNHQPTPQQRPFLNPRLQIHVLSQLILTLLLLFGSHVQIILRQVATIPAFWWALADGIQRHWHSPNHWGYWFPFIVIWNPISLVLWAGFYPPA